MFNIALAWAFLLSAVAAPGGKLLSLVFDAGGLKQVPPYQQVLFNIFANYWLPALLIYLGLRWARAGRFLNPGTPINVIYVIANSLLTFLVCARLFSSTIEGGGATFALMSLAPFVAWPAQMALVVATIWLVVRSVTSKSTAIAPATPPIGRSFSGVAALTMLFPPVGYFVWLYSANADAIHAASASRKAADVRFEELCSAVRIDIKNIATDTQSVFLPQTSELAYAMLNKLDYVEVKRPTLGMKRYTKKDGNPASVNGVMQAVNEESITEPTAQYEVTVKPVGGRDNGSMGLNVEEFTILDRRNGEALAVFTKANRSSGARMIDQCPRSFGVNYKYDLIMFVLGLHDKEKAEGVASKIAALGNEQAE